MITNTMQEIRELANGARALIAPVAALAVLVFNAGTAQAATPGAVYSYHLDGASASVVNQGSKTTVPLKLTGAWSQDRAGGGVHFAGDLVSQSSVGYAKPSSGATLSVASGTSGVGGAVAFTYHATTAGCFKDSVNLTQIGRFAANTTQVKLQLSKCGDATYTHVQCRVTGNVSSSATLPSRSTLALEDGVRYVARCFKGPDPASGKPRLTISVTRVDTADTVDSVSLIPRTGTMTSSAYLSVGNKYPLPAQAANTDQFVGEISRAAFCTGPSAQAVRDCLETEMTR
jgi:hypothetical protein